MEDREGVALRIPERLADKSRGSTAGSGFGKRDLSNISSRIRTLSMCNPFARTTGRRLRRLEESFAPQENEQGESLAELIRARRRRRLEGSGEPFEARPCASLAVDQNRPLSVADILRSGRRRSAVPTEPLAG